MSKLEWDKTGERLYHLGVDNGVVFPMMKGKYTSEGMIVAADTADGGCEIAFYSDNEPTGTRVH